MSESRDGKRQHGKPEAGSSSRNAGMPDGKHLHAGLRVIGSPVRNALTISRASALLENREDEAVPATPNA